MAFTDARTTKSRLQQFAGWAFWESILRQAAREFWYGPEPKRFGQWVYHPHRKTWEWRESATTWIPEQDHP